MPVTTPTREPVATAVVETQGLEKRYGSVAALRDVSFSVRAGEVLGMLGPNGAGKTTLIRILTTVLPPDAGTFAVGGEPHIAPTAIRRLVGVLPESAGYPERQTGEEYLRYHARLYGASRTCARAVAARLLEDVGLADRARSLISTYSRGMRQRLGIARALVNEPRVVFLDEPTLGLDPAGQRQVLGLVRRIASESGAAVLLSTHLLAEVEEVCSRVLILDRGRVVAEGTVSEVIGLAAAPRRARVRVSAADMDHAEKVLVATPGIDGVEAGAAQPGLLIATLAEQRGVETTTPALRALLEAGVDVLGFEIEGARLGDAFLAMTGRS